jgi:CTP:molybdopterin cytidylyltransferase MocA
MPAAFGAHPELIRRPRHARSGVSHLHLGPAALAADLKAGVVHAAILAQDGWRTRRPWHEAAGLWWAPDQPRRSCVFAYDVGMVIPAIVLAAGKSTRMGRAKATMPLAAETFLSRIVRTFASAGISDIVVVIGHEADRIRASFAQSGAVARFVSNPHYERGQLSSLQTGLNAIDAPGVAGALVMLVDVPLVSSVTVRAVVERYQLTHAPIVRPTRGTEHGHPVLIDRSLFEPLLRADPEAGAKDIVRAHASAAGDLEIDDEGAFFDIDTMEVYQRVVATRLNGGHST